MPLLNMACLKKKNDLDMTCFAVDGIEEYSHFCEYHRMLLGMSCLDFLSKYYLVATYTSSLGSESETL